jgi:hypothetical protein
MRAKAKAKITDIDTGLRQLSAMRGALTRLLATCARRGTLAMSILENKQRTTNEQASGGYRRPRRLTPLGARRAVCGSSASRATGSPLPSRAALADLEPLPPLLHSGRRGCLAAAGGWLYRRPPAASRGPAYHQPTPHTAVSSSSAQSASSPPPSTRTSSPASHLGTHFSNHLSPLRCHPPKTMPADLCLYFWYAAAALLSRRG